MLVSCTHYIQDTLMYTTNAVAKCDYRMQSMWIDGLDLYSP